MVHKKSKCLRIREPGWALILAVSPQTSHSPLCLCFIIHELMSIFLASPVHLDPHLDLEIRQHVSGICPSRRGTSNPVQGNNNKNQTKSNTVIMMLTAKLG